MRLQYTLRIDQLDVLTASASAMDGRLSNVKPTFLSGVWIATGIHDPAGGGTTDPLALQQSLENAELPHEGGIIKASPGKLCPTTDTCGPRAWDWTTLPKVDGGLAIIRCLKLTPTTHALAGSSSSKDSYYLLIPQSNGTLWAAFGFCGPAVGQNCRRAAEVWAPTGPDATISPRP